VDTKSRKIRWGILGTGVIARAFAEGLRHARGAVLRAVGSRTLETAGRFAGVYGVPGWYGSYEELAADPTVDVIYVATPHAMHMEHTLLALDAGKAVLCEKPFALNAAQAERMARRAGETGLFLMEAMWTRFLPAVRAARDWVKEGRIGALRMVQADFGFRADPEDEPKLLEPALGGGSLLDVGCYPVSMVCWLFGAEPVDVTGCAVLGPTGVDEWGAAVLRFPCGGVAQAACAIRVETPQEAALIGETGVIRLKAPFWRCEHITLEREGRMVEEARFPITGNGYHYEAEVVMDSIRAGQTEHPDMPLSESVAVMRTLDRIRSVWGVRYPGEPGL